MLINFRISFNPRNFFNGGRLLNGRVPGAFLAFSLLSGIGTASYRTGCSAMAIRSSRRLDINLGRCGRVHTLIR